jgi:hypothetical protein
MRDNDSLILEGAYLEILEESRKKRYLEMFKGIPERFASFFRTHFPHGKSAEDWKQQAIDTIQQDIEWAIKNLKREDRILWYLRQIKIGLYLETDEILETLRKLYKEMSSKDREKNQRIADEYNKLVNSLPTAIRKSVAFKQFDPSPYADNISKYRTKLDNFFIHFLSLSIPKIDNFRFENQSWQDIHRDFEQYEKEWAEKQKSWIDITNELKEGKISPVVVFDDGFRWFNLNRPKCEQEGKAMGHCGNCGGRSDDTILSLRKLKQEGGRMYTRPSLTFILHHNGQLGEMKGRGNNKPNEKYHPYIMRLLAQKNLVKGIEGGGYLPENNFSLNDLNDERLEAFFDARPDILIEDRTSLKKVIRYYISKDKVLPEGFLNLQTAHGSWPLAADIAFEYGNFLMNKNKEIPYILYISMGHGSNSAYALSFADHMIENNMEVPDVLLTSVAKDPERSFDLADRFLEVGKDIPKILILGLSGMPNLSRRMLEKLIENSKTTEWNVLNFALEEEAGTCTEWLLQSISTDPDVANEFVKLLVKNNMEIPEVIIKSVDRNPFDAVRFASMMIKASKTVADNIIYTISTDPESSEIVAEYMVRHNYKNIPEIILKSILENDRMTKDFADFLKKQNKELPPVLNTFLNLSSKGFI